MALYLNRKPYSYEEVATSSYICQVQICFVFVLGILIKGNLYIKGINLAIIFAVFGVIFYELLTRLYSLVLESAFEKVKSALSKATAYNNNEAEKGTMCIIRILINVIFYAFN